jgi:hypothetical protein
MASSESGLPDRCYAYLPSGSQGPNGAKSLRKLRLCDVASEKFDCQIIGNAAAAFSAGGFRGNPVQLPAGAIAAAKRRVRAARAAAKCQGPVPASIA